MRNKRLTPHQKWIVEQIKVHDAIIHKPIYMSSNMGHNTHGGFYLLYPDIRKEDISEATIDSMVAKGVIVYDEEIEEYVLAEGI